MVSSESLPEWEIKVRAVVKEVLKNRAESHGYSHACLVTNRCREILCHLETEKDQQGFSAAVAYLFGSESLVAGVITIAALTHDVDDHKYADEDGAVERDDVMRSLLADVSWDLAAAAVGEGAEAEEIVSAAEKVVDCVSQVIMAISFSNEQRDGLPEHFSSTPGLMFLRNCVSDADKMEAIGLAGVERCTLYSVEQAERERAMEWKARLMSAAAAGAPASGGGEEDSVPGAAVEEVDGVAVDESPITAESVHAEVLQHAREKLLILREKYIRTDAGMALSEPLQREMEEWYASAQSA